MYTLWIKGYYDASHLLGADHGKKILIEAQSLTYGEIISSTLNQAIKNSVMIDKQQVNSFYRVFLCHGCDVWWSIFPKYDWEWKKSSSPFHVYYLDLWETRYKYEFMRICNNFLIPLQAILTCEPTPCMSQDAMNAISKMGDWYVSSSSVYICIYGSMKEPPQVLHYALDNRVLLEISYQTYVGVF